MQNDPLAGWRIATELSLEDIAILLAGGDPGAIIPDDDWQDRIHSPKRDRELPAVAGFLRALEADARSGTLPARLALQALVSTNAPNALLLVDQGEIQRVLSWDSFAAAEDRGSTAWADKLVIERAVDWGESRVRVADLRVWLKAKGLTGTFFDAGDGQMADEPLSPSRPRFAPELDLALAAWRAVSEAPTIKGTVKQALEAWIHDNPDAWRGDVPMSVGALDRIITVANWHRRGGAPRQS